MRLIVLGSGSSAGTPVIGCHCATCSSSDPRNKRTRCSSAIILPGGETLLIDTGPDLRQQALREGLKRVDAVLYTHAHADHMHGIDDLRAFCQLQRQQIPLYGNAQTIHHISEKFPYVLREPSDFWDLPVLSGKCLTEPLELFGTMVTPIPVKHGHSDILGYRIGNLAYITDVSIVPESSLLLLQGLEVLMLDCLRFRPHPTHIGLEQSLAYAGMIGARQTYLIHMTHEIEYAAVSQLLPPGIRLAYDGLRIDIAS
ncbi:MAG TPA: MBL fold metallo-hydrolase [Methylophilaceae bacterium]|jgi:phosphoribosyl 1,2-cyclic phosphate phosphodiesterase